MTLTELLQNLERSKFYGVLELRYESGHIVLARRTESIKLAEDFRNSRGINENKITR